MTGNADIIRLVRRDENLHQSITQQVMKIWQDVESEGFKEITKNNEQVIYDAYGVAVENEKRWAEYLFSDGPLVGLNAKVLGVYSEWLANNRLRALGYNAMFDAPVNPIGGWLSRYDDSSKVQVAPQEREITSYKKSALKKEELNLEGFSF